jgi:hypothetical protein
MMMMMKKKKEDEEEGRCRRRKKKNKSQSTSNGNPAATCSLSLSPLCSSASHAPVAPRLLSARARWLLIGNRQLAIASGGSSSAATGN